MICRSIVSIALILTSIPLTAAEAQWPQFRGPDGQGHAAAANLATSWSETENIAWKTAIPGRGWSSPVIAGNQIWLTTAVESPVSEAEKAERVKGTTNNQPLVVSGKLSLRAVCVDRHRGSVVADIELLTEDRPQPTHAMNSFASPTPVLDGGKLYAHYGAYGTACLDTQSREVVWINRELMINHENGPGSSPVLWGDRLIVHCDGSDAQYIAALDTATGRVAWKTDRSGKMNAEPQLKKCYGTPLVVEIAGQPHVVSPAADWLYGYDPTSGRELWKVPYGQLGFSIAPRPVAGHGLVYMSTAFTQPQLLAVKLGEEPTIVWRYAKQMPTICSPLLLGDELYTISDKGIMTCLDAHTGSVHWTQRLPGNYAASPLLADGKIYCCNRDGETTVLKPGRQFASIGSARLDGQILASPAAVEQALYVRTDKALYRIERQ